MMTTYYAIGLPGNPPRMFVAGNPEIAQLQLQNENEVFVEVERPGYGVINADGTAFDPNGIDMEMEAIKIRTLRTSLLSASDWTQTADAPLSAAQRQRWVEYRQELRDITTSQSGKMFAEIIWPAEPTN